MPSEYGPRETLELMLGHLGFTFEVREERGPQGLVLQIETRDPGRLIGRNGKTIEDLQYLLNRILAPADEEHSTVIVDVEHYRSQQQREFQAKIRGAIEKVRRTGEAVTLPPLNSFDRRVVHTTCQEEPDLATESEPGDGRLKQITIRLKKARK